MRTAAETLAAGTRRRLETLLLHAHTLRHLRPVQVWGRLAAPARRRWTALRLPSPAADLLGEIGEPEAALRFAPHTDFVEHDGSNDRAALWEGEFRFLGRALELGWPPEWHDAAARELPLAWRLHLHSHQFLELLPVQERLVLCRSWIDAHPPGTEAAWHSRALSRRIASWCRSLPPDPGPEIAHSLWRQAAYLARNVERHAPGNRLLDNARALVLAAAWFGDRGGEVVGWRTLGLEILKEETPEQVLPDGVHFERSPMVQAEVLELYLDVLNVLPLGHSHRERLREAAGALADGLASLTHPDGRIALLNDAALDVAARPATLFEYLWEVTGHAPCSQAALPWAGYYLWDRSPAWLVVDGGPLGPSHLTAHAHADLFSYELSLGGHRFIVDTGTSTYEAGPERDHERGTRAHNTVCVDGLDQAEVWGSFRVARRWLPENVTSSVDANDFRFAGEFGGWAERIGDGIRHRRELAGAGHAGSGRGGSGHAGSGAGGGEIRVEDTISGRGEHRVESLVHLHPRVEIEREPSAEKTVRLTRDGATARLVVEAGRLNVEDSVYCPRFGERLPSKAIVLTADSLPARLAYRVVY